MLLKSIALARIINKYSHGAVIAPWEVEELDEMWLDAFRGLAYDLPGYQEAEKRTAELKQAWLVRSGYKS